VRIAAHVHSSWSYDASWALDDIAAAFARRRYDVVLMAEHDRGFDQSRWAEYQRACADASTDHILLVPGIEYEDDGNVVHIPVWGEDIPFLGAGRPTLDLLRSARSEGAVAVFAHPWRRDAITRYRPEWAPLLSAVEIWNRKYDGIAPDTRGVALAQAEELAAFVSLDFHTSRQFFPLAMSVTLDGPATAPSLVEAIRDGRCRPELLGLSALRFTRGLEGATLRALEAVRRGLRGPVRRVQRQLSG
jgi:predicted metal-dependent phosphoesterase TrpH